MQEKPKLIIVGGPNGSGKTSITWKILNHEWVNDCVYINPDEIARDKYGDWNSPDAVIKAANYAKELREKCLLQKKVIYLRQSCLHRISLPILQRLKKMDFLSGYFL